MTTPILLKRIEGLEIWRTQSGSAECFAVKPRKGAARIVSSLERAEEMLSALVHRARLARAH